MLAIISLKKLRFPGTSCSAKNLEWRSHRAASRMSASRIDPFELLYANTLHCVGWNSAAVITSVKSSMLDGLMSTMLNDWFDTSRFHRLTRKSSAEMNVSQSLLMLMELMWYACALANNLRHREVMITSDVVTDGNRSDKTFWWWPPPPPPPAPEPPASASPPLTEAPASPPAPPKRMPALAPPLRPANPAAAAAPPAAPAPAPLDAAGDALPEATLALLELPSPTLKLLTRLTRFSNTFHNLIVLSLVLRRKRDAPPPCSHHLILFTFSSISRLFK
mmetsp:Transcript_3567/g.12791  ORF Transcript_3567/g.12791 Transcript_3567/m.12791 type:complete len:277 (-) Transcript_3567:530-1360(-)